ncbi:hypothetical protein GOP47_0007144 [Adiantum capillus-veneris]|uniref:SPX domain-containing protein n=1 Tax=Adiantum capillus-veneris TaxID=13818 RepID=A0A9D4ZLL9_ADICA|nr:hypothetical protein GOP47_0007144 [Adiantum capillus-veneris]
MVHFGRYIKSHQVPGWETYYIQYKQLKKRINECAIHVVEGSEEERQEILRRFSKLLDSQVEKIVLFLIERQGLLAGRLQQLRERAESELEDENMELMVTLMSDKETVIEAYRQVGKDLLNLLQYVEMNTMGLRKILKKFDKRLGLRLREHYLLTRLNHPYSQVQQVLRQVGIGAIIATISRNLAELHSERWRSYSSLTLSSHLPKVVATKEPIIKAIEHEYQKLTREASLLSFMANAFLLQPSDGELSDSVSEETEYHPWSAYLNQLNTFLYMVNYYIIVPTSDDYAQLLNTPATVSGVVIGSMPLTATVSAVIFTLWSNKTYKAPLVVSTVLLIIGNLSYALALPFNSVWLLLLGRALEGLGCARAINRRYIMHEVPQAKIRNFSAAFVSASALGMTVGPALASALSSVNFEVGGVIVNYCTASGWVLGFAWSLYLLLVLFFFKEPNKFHHEESRKFKEESSSPKEEDFGALAPLLGSSLHKEGETKKSNQKSGSFVEVLKEMTLPIQILLLNCFMLKFASEMLISEATLVTGYYFSWSSSTVGWFLGALGVTVLPSSAVVANYISNKFQDRLIIIWTIMLTAAGVIGNLSFAPLIHYTQAQYVISSLILFVSTNVLEGVDMSLLAKMMSPRLSKGLFNCGFLSTEAGTIARALADGLITLVGRAGMANLLNFTMLPTLGISLGTLFFTWFGYYSLY